MRHCNYTGYCDELEDPINGAKDSDDNFQGETVTFFCNDGFNLSGNSIRTCQPDGKWSGSQPQCIRTFIALL